MELADHYASLGVDPGCDATALRMAYRARVLALHPDKASGGVGPGNGQSPGVGPAGGEYAWEAVQRAWAVLRDPGSRAAYDAARALAERRSTHVQVHARLQAVDMAVEQGADGRVVLTHPCRCGDAFRLDLEEAGEPGVVLLVPCASCSLFAQVHT